MLLFSSSQLNGSLLELDYLTKPIEISELTQALDQHWLMAETVRPTRTILVVDDEPNTLEMHARIVQAHSIHQSGFEGASMGKSVGTPASRDGRPGFAGFANARDGRI